MLTMTCNKESKSLFYWQNLEEPAWKPGTCCNFSPTVEQILNFYSEVDVSVAKIANFNY